MFDELLFHESYVTVDWHNYLLFHQINWIWWIYYWNWCGDGQV